MAELVRTICATNVRTEYMEHHQLGNKADYRPTRVPTMNSTASKVTES